MPGAGETVANQIKTEVFDPLFKTSESMRENLQTARWVLKMLTGEFVFDKWGAVASFASATGADELDYGAFLAKKSEHDKSEKNGDEPECKKRGKCWGICDMIAQV